MIFDNAGVQIRDGQPASAVLHSVLKHAVQYCPDALSAAGIPSSAATFRRKYVNLLPQFEVARIASPHRTDIAREMTAHLQDHLVYTDRNGTRPLAASLSDSAQPLALTSASPASAGTWRPTVDYRGKTWDDLAALGRELHDRHVASAAVRDALSWLESNVLEAGQLNLQDRKVVILGANAEMAPTAMLLAAGADVLWLDVVPPPESLLHSEARHGELSWASDNADLLSDPGAILATIIAFSGNHPVDLCLYAYAPGQARELRLTCAMNAVVDALPPAIVASVTLLLSPTTATPVDHDDLLAMAARRDARPVWESLLDAFSLLGRGGGSARQGQVGATRTLVGIQGLSYQAAQYLGKLIIAECWAGYGQLQAESPQPLRVAASTAAITRTRSMDHPVFDAAFEGAGALQVETFTPPQSQHLNGLLAVHDWLNPEMPKPGTVRVHGGIHTLPYPLDKALRIAAVIGFAKSPVLLGGLLGRRN